MAMVPAVMRRRLLTQAMVGGGAAVFGIDTAAEAGVSITVLSASASASSSLESTTKTADWPDIIGGSPFSRQKIDRLEDGKIKI